MLNLFKRKKVTVRAGALELLESNPSREYNEAQVTAYLTHRNKTMYFTSTVGRELRKLREAGKVLSRQPEGKRYKVYRFNESYNHASI